MYRAKRKSRSPHVPLHHVDNAAASQSTARRDYDRLHEENPRNPRFGGQQHHPTAAWTSLRVKSYTCTVRSTAHPPLDFSVCSDLRPLLPRVVQASPLQALTVVLASLPLRGPSAPSISPRDRVPLGKACIPQALSSEGTTVLKARSFLETTAVRSERREYRYSTVYAFRSHQKRTVHSSAGGRRVNLPPWKRCRLDVRWGKTVTLARNDFRYRYFKSRQNCLPSCAVHAAKRAIWLVLYLKHDVSSTGGFTP